MKSTKGILNLAVEIGDIMLQNGGEIFRVEDTVTRILKANDIEEFDVYVISNGIFASANEDKEDAASVIRHVPLGAVNLNKVSELNQLARDVCSEKVSFPEAWEVTRRIKEEPFGYSNGGTILFAGIGCAAFCCLFGGQWLDCLFAFLVGILEQGLLILFQKKHLSRFLTNLCASLFVTFLSILVLWLGFPVLHDKIIIGGIMLLVPGVAFTVAIRDYYNGDHLAGTIHLVDAILTATLIALGVCISIWICSYLGMNIEPDGADLNVNLMLILQFVVAIFATIGFAVLFGAPKKETVLCGITGAIGWIIYEAMIVQDINGLLATGVAAFVLTFVVRCLAVCRRMPATVYLLPGIFPLVPGSQLYYTAYYLFLGSRDEFVSHGILTFELAGAIVFGIILGMALPQMIFGKLRRAK